MMRTWVMLFVCLSYASSYQLIFITKQLPLCKHRSSKNNFNQVRSFIPKLASNNSPDLDKSNLMGKIFKALRPIIGFYAVMLAPVYGIGLPLWFGSITDFSTLKNRPTFNEYIVAPKGFTNARMNELSSTYPVSAKELHDTIEYVVLKQPRITKVTEDIPTMRLEYVQRSLIFRFPDVITFQVVPVSSRESSLAVHSYSIYGGSDLGVNGNRIRSWISEIEEIVDK